LSPSRSKSRRGAALLLRATRRRVAATISSRNAAIWQEPATQGILRLYGNRPPRLVFSMSSRPERVGVFHHEPVLIKLLRIHRGQAREPLSSCINHIQVTVRTIIPSQPDVRTRGLRIGGIHLQDRR